MPRGGIESLGQMRVLSMRREFTDEVVRIQRPHTISVVPECFLEFCKVPVLVGLCDGTHTLDLPELCVFDCELDRKESVDVLGLTISSVDT